VLYIKSYVLCNSAITTTASPTTKAPQTTTESVTTKAPQTTTESTTIRTTTVAKECNSEYIFLF